jgi:hypothetical protein
VLGLLSTMEHPINTGSWVPSESKMGIATLGRWPPRPDMCNIVEPPKGGNIVLCRGRSPHASVGKSGFGNGPAIDFRGAGLIEHALDVRASSLFSDHPLYLIHCLSHLSGH